ncbi:spoIIIJ-associated protein [Bifidobacterium commune]|uniref:SpoIIIJ-associated protein n=1 Tax=Bifidobacterium commune TaxID=1505727 RepID=A0A1C4H6L4_9BIFI|nr:spoIIIJ-associated protein [Bifidobacterium commune]SCC80371.1 spoIIIJ-associated protein [Bifidobacterium commune]
MSIDEEKTVEQLNVEADIAADYLEGLLDIADYEGDIEMGVRNGRPTVQIVADDNEDIKNLIGHNGDVVDALQLLTRLAVQQKTGERSRLILDVDGYLRKRRERLRDSTLDVIDEVRETGEQVDLKPMNSFERKVVHDLVREKGLRSRSHGEEPHRYVSVFLKAHAADSALDDEDITESNLSDPIVEDTTRRRAPRAGRDIDLDEVVDIDVADGDRD